MFKRIAPFAALSLLSGCALTNGDEYHQATLSAIQSSEANMTQKMTNLESQMGLQNDYIESLEKQITELKTQVSQIKLPPPLPRNESPLRNRLMIRTPLSASLAMMWCWAKLRASPLMRLSKPLMLVSIRVPPPHH